MIIKSKKTGAEQQISVEEWNQLKVAQIPYAVEGTTMDTLFEIVSDDKVKSDYVPKEVKEFSPKPDPNIPPSV